MPMLMVLALAAQTATLEADPREAAFTCGAAVRTLPDSLNLANSTVGMWFAMKAATLDPTEGMLLQKIGPAMQTVMKRVEDVRDDRDALIAQCRRRFPLAWKTSGVELPAGEYERRTGCAFNTIAYSALAKSQEGGKYGAQAESLADRLTTLLDDDELLAHGGDLGAQGEASRLMTAGLDLGNLRGIAAACAAAFPA